MTAPRRTIDADLQIDRIELDSVLSGEGVLAPVVVPAGDRVPPSADREVAQASVRCSCFFQCRKVDGDFIYFARGEALET